MLCSLPEMFKYFFLSNLLSFFKFNIIFNKKNQKHFVLNYLKFDLKHIKELNKIAIKTYIKLEALSFPIQLNKVF